MATTEETMFEYIKSLNDVETVTFGTCVNSFHHFEKGTKDREILVEMACKILISVYYRDPNNLHMTEDEISKLLQKTLEFK
tara:strand:+ start:274 stop:516 length:243 start_codon:yes stop_codon:yes gene_type:complete